MLPPKKCFKCGHIKMWHIPKMSYGEIAGEECVYPYCQGCDEYIEEKEEVEPPTIRKP
jgi:hypothetical protein